MLEHDWFPEPVPSNVTIGPDGWFHSSFAFRHYRSRRPRGVVVGRGCGIYLGTLFDLGPDGEVSIGDTSTLAGPVFVTNQRIEIGARALISSRVLLADEPCAVPPTNATPTVAPDEPRPVAIRIGDDCWVGTNAILLAGTDLGDGAIVGAGSVVDFAVRAGCVVAGNPARVVGRNDGGAR